MANGELFPARASGSGCVPPVEHAVGPSRIQPISIPTTPTDPSPNHGFNIQEAALRQSPAPRIELHKESFKIMIAGESGLGKSTFINNIFASYQAGQLIMPDRGAGQARAVNPALFSHDGAPAANERTLAIDQSCSFSVITADGRTQITYRIVDTPGWGDDMDNSLSISKVTDFLLSLHRLHHERPYDSRNVIEDERVACVLYFIAPHRIKPVDIEFMKRLSKLAPLIPVVGKTDTMSKHDSEVDQFRKKVLDDITDKKNGNRNEIQCFQNWNGDPRLEVFFVGASKVWDQCRMEQNPPQYWPIRKYPWGTCEILNPEHTDTSRLKVMMLETSYGNLQASKEQVHTNIKQDDEAFRRGERTEPTLGVVGKDMPICLSTLIEPNDGDTDREVRTAYVTRWLDARPGAITNPYSKTLSDYENFTLEPLAGEVLPFRDHSKVALKHCKSGRYMSDQSSRYKLLGSTCLSWNKKYGLDWEKFELVKPQSTVIGSRTGDPAEVEALLDHIYIGSKVMIKSLANDDDPPSYLYLDKESSRPHPELNPGQYGYDLVIADEGTVWTVCDAKGRSTVDWSTAPSA